MVYDELHFHPNCPACDGRGWQSDAMPVSDALADAETLRLNSGYVLAKEIPDDPYAARTWARLSFWAVPGLREEMSE